MGNCGGIKEIDLMKYQNQHNHNQRQVNSNQQYVIIKSQKKANAFADFEEYKNGKTIGNGIHQIPSFKCPMAYDELNQLREDFWRSRPNNQRIWSVIKECCNTDSETAVMLLEAAEMACQGDLRKVFLLSNPDIVFTVPNFCVCDPCFERDYNAYQNKVNMIKDQTLNIVLYYLAKNQNVNLQVTNKTLVKEVKRLFANKVKINQKSNVIRLLFKGQELVDDHLLYYHNVENGSKIHVMVRSNEV